MSRIMRRDLPARRAAERKSAHDDSVLVDVVAAAHVSERFEEVGFAREFLAVAEAAVSVQHDGIARREFAVAALAFTEKVQFRQGLAAPVEPHIEPPCMRIVRLKTCRHHETVRLHRAVEHRHVAAHYQPSRARPRRAPFAYLLHAFQSLLQQRARAGNFVGGIQNLVVAQRPIDSLVKNFHVRQQRERVRFAL